MTRYIVQHQTSHQGIGRWHNALPAFENRADAEAAMRRLFAAIDVERTPLPRDTMRVIEVEARYRVLVIGQVVFESGSRAAAEREANRLNREAEEELGEELLGDGAASVVDTEEVA